MDLLAYLCFMALIYCYESLSFMFDIIDCFLAEDIGDANDLDISLSALLGVDASLTIGFLIWFIYKYIKLD